MNVLGVNKLFELSKQAKKDKDYNLENQYLMQAYSLSPNNTKIINAIIRNLRKLGNIAEVKKWLYVLYEIKPDGKILFELEKIERSLGNMDKVREILLKSRSLSSNSKKINRRLRRINQKENTHTNSNTLLTISETEEKVINEAREIIYGEDDYLDKKNKILELISSLSDEIILTIMSEFYKKNSSDVLAIKQLKNYKSKLNPEVDVRKTKIINKVLEIVLNKKSRRFNWNEFWIANATTYSDKTNSKVLVKK